MDESKHEGAQDWRHNSPPDGYTEREIAFLTEQLQAICGQPLTRIRQLYGDVFEFGAQRPQKNRKGDDVTWADFRLSIICADWHVVQRGRIILGSREYRDETHLVSDFDESPETPQIAESRRIAREFLDGVTEGKFIVQSVVVRDHADMVIWLSDDLVIESFSSSCQDEDSWHFCNDNAKVSGLIGAATCYTGTFDDQFRRKPPLAQ